MDKDNLVRGRGTIASQPHTGRLFVESPEHFYAIDNSGPVRVMPGDSVKFEAVYGDQFARVTAVRERRAS